MTDGPPASWFARAWGVVRETGQEWWADNVSRLSAALAYYTAFAIAPLLVIGVKVAGLFYGQRRSEREAGKRLEQLLGGPAASAVQDILNRAASAHTTGTWSAVVGLAVLVYAARTLFAELQASMNSIWEVEAGPDRTWTQRLRDRMWPFLLILATGVLLLASVAAGPVLAALNPHVNGPMSLHHAARVAVSLAVFTVAFGVIYKVLPDVTIHWGDAAIGAAVTAVLFTAGELLLQWYLSRPGVLSVYGTAGSVGVLLLWVYYSAQVLFLGAEFTQVWARRVGHPLEPARGAVRVEKRRRRTAHSQTSGRSNG